jgi:hypothetical protein
VKVPADTLERMSRAETAGPAAEQAEGLRIAQEVLAGVRGLVQGIQVSVPPGRTEVALEVLQL